MIDISGALNPKAEHDPFNYGNPDLDSHLSKQPFVRSNAGFVKVDPNHKIEIFGKLYTRRDLTCRERKHITVCTECAGNSRTSLTYQTEGLQWDNRAVHNVLWSGILLKNLLPSIPKNAVEIVFTSLDKEFARSLPINVINERPVIIALEMNGKVLPMEHGYPARLIVPGWYGMASVKWLDKIYFTDKPFEGEYQTNKYTYLLDDKTRKPVTAMLPKSIITNIEVQNPIVIKGKAWSGEKISKVEISINGEWKEAKIIERSGDYGWVGWSLKIDLPKGSYTLGSKATDENGSCQPDTPEKNFWGYGNNGIQYIGLVV